MNVPNVIVIGASKCGTTSLYYYLSKHSDIFLPAKKELHFHSSKELQTLVGGTGDKFLARQICVTAQDYLKHYGNADIQKVKVDVSPSYLFFPSSITSIKSLCGEDVKIICLIRHPVDKIISQYSHLLSAGRETLNFKEALLKEQERKINLYGDMWLYRESGYMSDKIKVFKENFKHVLILNSDQLYADLKETLNIIFDFIGVDKNIFHDYSLMKKNFSGKPRSLLVSKIFIQPNYFTNTLRRIVPQELGRVVREKINNRNKGEKVQLEPECYRELEEEYSEEIKKLNDLVEYKIKCKYR